MPTEHDNLYRPIESDHRRVPTKWLIGGAAALAVLLVAGGVTTVVRRSSDHGGPAQAQNTTVTTTTSTFSGLTFVPNHPPVDSDFSSWNRFGGIDATFSDHGRTVRLDTHDTVDTWTTKWSGLSQPGATACSLRFTGRVRDVSHSPGVAGGYGIGIATVDTDSGAQTLRGSAVQYDFGQQGWRLADYPSDGASSLIPTPLDNAWHSIDVTITTTGQVAVDLDGQSAVRSTMTPSCGRPTIRVWAGAAEFSNTLVGQVG